MAIAVSLGHTLNDMEAIGMAKDDVLVKLDEAMRELGNTKRGAQNRKTAYSFIKTLLDMGGSSISFFAICDKMAESYPNCSYPAYVVKVLKRHGIVSNTGSNKYPRWSLPTNATAIIGKAIEEYRP